MAYRFCAVSEQKVGISGHLHKNDVSVDELALSHFLPLFCPENVFCFLRLLHIFKCTSD